MLYRTVNPHGGDVYEKRIELDYSANTNPYGTPESVIKAMADSLNGISRYPDPYCRQLVRAISAYESVPEDFILCGNGAAELIYSYCEAVSPSLACELAPTFSEYSLSLRKTGARIERYMLRGEDDFAAGEDILGYLDRVDPDVLFLCNPNNPTGRLMEPELLERILELCRNKGIKVMLDECFIDLAGGKSLSCLLDSHPELLILKAFTKNYGMAGVRLGYCLTSDGELLGRMAATVQPWNVSTLAQAAGTAATGERAFLDKTVRTVAEERPWLSERLKDFGFRVIPSSANFILFKGPEDLQERLLEQGIAIRNCDNYIGLEPGWYRIAVRLREQNTRLIEAMKMALGDR